VAPLALGTNTDPYQPIERDLKVMRACLKVLSLARHPTAIVTKGALVERDIDILQDMARDKLVRVGISVTTLDETLCRKMEPRAPSPSCRLRTIETLTKAGIDVRIMASPMVSGLTDSELESILQAGADAGATCASWIMLRLPREVSPLWQEWLNTHYPERAAKVMTRLREMHGGKDYDARWGHRMRGTGHFATLVAHRFKLALRKTGLSETAPELNCDLFRPPQGQLSLF
jgi:DNA repair photolyase